MPGPPPEIQEWREEHRNPQVAGAGELRDGMTAAQDEAGRLEEQVARLQRKLAKAERAASGDSDSHEFNLAVRHLEHAKEKAAGAVKQFRDAQKALGQYKERADELDETLPTA